MSDWRQDQDLVRDDQDAIEPPAPLDARWSGIFDHLVPMVLGDRGGHGLMGQAVKLMVHQGRRYVSRNPEQARSTVIEAMRAVAAQLRIEPGELYDLSYLMAVGAAAAAAAPSQLEQAPAEAPAGG